MPGLNGKGPQGAGPKTGRGLGKCNPSAGSANSAGTDSANNDNAGRGMGLRKGRCAGNGSGLGQGTGQAAGQGMQRGMGQGRGAGSGQGRGQGRGAGGGRGAGRGRL